MNVVPYTSEESGKKKQVTRMFNNIAGQYDLLNHLLSFNFDRYWRKQAIKSLKHVRHASILDIATGTGDLAIRALDLNPLKVTGIDISDKMVWLAREKLKKKKLPVQIDFIQADAEDLPFPDESFDIVISGFGVRNFGDLPKGISETYRVLRNGGHLVILEFSKPDNSLTGRVFRFYFTQLLPKAGGLVSGDLAAYRYLPESVNAFPDGGSFLEVISDAGFRDCRFKRLTLGIATIYSGIKPL